MITLTRFREALADRLCWSAFQRDNQIYLQVLHVADNTPGMTEDQADVLVRGLAWVKLESAIIYFLYALAATIRPYPDEDDPSCET